MTGALLVQASASSAETADLLEAAEGLPFVLGVVGWADLTSPEVDFVIDALRAGPGRPSPRRA